MLMLRAAPKDTDARSERTFILSAEALSEDDERRAGGKAIGLARLRALGLRVPPFCVISTDACRVHLGASEVLAALGALLIDYADTGEDWVAAETYAAPAAALRNAVESHPVDPGLAAALTKALADVGDGPYAVRSSMVGEDSTRHSFAGQLDTMLFVSDVDEVLDAVKRCWASAFGDRALAYAHRAGLSAAGLRVGVVVQQMVPADRAGVIFTANPVNGNRDECLVTAATGVGEGVVSGISDTDEYVWSPDGGERSATVREKELRVVRAAAGSGTCVEAVPADGRSERVLSPGEVADLCELACAIVEDAGQPMDVEWCYAAGEPYLLQARPITSLPLAPDPAAPVRIYDNANIQESYNGVTTPLTFSFASRAYSSVFRQFAQTIGTSDRALAAFEPAAKTLIGLVHGRVFYNLDSWVRFLELFPGGERKRQDMETVMWHTRIEGSAADRKPAAERAREAAELGSMAVRMLARFARLDSEISRFHAHFRAVYDSVDRERLRHATLTELHVTSRRLQDELLDQWEAPNINDLRVLMACGRLRRLLEKVHGNEAEVRLVDLLGGIEGIQSVLPTKILVGLARDIRRYEGLADIFRTGPPNEALAALHRQAPRLASVLDDYIVKYGDRCIGELKLETVPLRDDPVFIVRVLTNYLNRPELDPENLTCSERERFHETLGDLMRRVPAWRRPVLRREVTLARKAVKEREALRLCRTLAFGLARDIYTGMGLRLAEAGVLSEARDVMYLSVDELEAFIEGRAVSVDLAAIAGVRKAEYRRYEAQDVPNRFRAVGSPYLGELRPEPVEDVGGPASAGVLRGLGCCAGIAEAPVRVLLDPRDELSVNGCIICTIRTDPGWAPLFPTASGLIVERGSALSHSAVVAREFGIPTVVGVAGVTQMLRDGEIVRVDGDAGSVERVEAAPSRMTEEKVRQRVRSMVEQLAPVHGQAVTSSTLVVDLGFDSLGVIELAVAIEQDLGLAAAAEDEDIARVETVADIEELALAHTESAAPERLPPVS